jgi:hypothetical protein
MYHALSSPPNVRRYMSHYRRVLRPFYALSPRLFLTYQAHYLEAQMTRRIPRTNMPFHLIAGLLLVFLGTACGNTSQNAESPAGSLCQVSDTEILSASLTLSYSGSGQDESSTVSLEREAEVTFLMEKTPDGHWVSGTMSGRARIHDTYTTPSYTDEIRGDATPLAASWATLRLEEDCTLSAEIHLVVEADNSTISRTAPSGVATIYLVGLETDMLSSAADLPAHTWYFGQSGSGVGLAGGGGDYTDTFAQPLGMILGHDTLGSAAVSWAFTEFVAD